MLHYTDYSDQQLAVLLSQSDERAFAEIYDRFQGLLYVYACKIVKDFDEAEDIVQEVLISLWDKRKNIVLRGTLSAYLYSAVRYKFMNLLDHRKVRQDYRDSMQQFINRGEYLIDNYIREKEFSVLIEREISLLPEKMQEIFMMSRKLNMNNKEIAQTLNITEKTVRNQINNSLRQLRTKLGLFGFAIYMLFY